MQGVSAVADMIQCLRQTDEGEEHIAHRMRLRLSFLKGLGIEKKGICSVTRVNEWKWNRKVHGDQSQEGVKLGHHDSLAPSTLRLVLRSG